MTIFMTDAKFPNLPEPDPPVMAAAMRDDVQTLDQLLDNTPSLVNWCEPGGYSPLHCAAEFNSCRVAARLVERGAPINAMAAKGTPLHYAAFAAHRKMVVLLLDAGADWSTKDDLGCTPLVTAARLREPAGRRLANAMLRHGVECDLHAAVCLGKTSRVREILTSDPNAISKCDVPADLIFDALSMIDYAYLAYYGGPDGLPKAIAKYRALCELLVSAGVPLDAPSRWAGPLLHLHVDFGANEAIIKFLLDLGADPNVVDANGETAWQIAKRRGRVKIAALLRGRGAK